MDYELIETDVLIIGAGMAGIRAAVEAHDLGAEVVLTTKGIMGRDCAATWMAYKGFQCWGIHPHDTIDVQAGDIIRCGWFLNNQENVYAFLAHVPEAARELLRWGGRYEMEGDQFSTIWQLGCSIPEGRSIIPIQWPRGILGYNYSRILPHAVRVRKIPVLEDMFIADLLSNEDAVVGAVGIDIRKGKFVVLKAKATIIATGGYQGVFKVTTATPKLTGDGQAMALRAGVDMMDFEFNQTLPCAIWPPALAGDQIPFILATEWDAHLLNNDGERFLSKWDPIKMEHSTRAVLSRGIYHEIKNGKASPHGGVYTSVAHIPADIIAEKLSENERSFIFERLKKSGINLHKDGIETGYSIHYCQGGCNVDSRCETNRPGLYAIGEAASGGKDGADRMMATSLPYCMGMGIIAGREAVKTARKTQTTDIDSAQVNRILTKILEPLQREEGITVYHPASQLQDIMARETGYGRTEDGLNLALDEIERYKTEVIPRLRTANKAKRYNTEWIDVLEFENVLLMAECLVRNALLRTESRGLHDRLDYAAPSSEWFKNIHITLQDGQLKQWTSPVEFTYWKPEEGTMGEPWHKGIQLANYTGWTAEPLYKNV
jgi:succinate dehydrogenase / fumarate reductase flavoprotein subunit